MTDTPASTAAADAHVDDPAHDGHGNGEHAHGHDEIHMPPNSWAPISMALALTCTFVGFVTTPLEPWLWIVGLVWVVGSGAAWFRGARNEFNELPD
jgi:hypothetical protein